MILHDALRSLYSRYIQLTNINVSPLYNVYYPKLYSKKKTNEHNIENPTLNWRAVLYKARTIIPHFPTRSTHMVPSWWQTERLYAQEGCNVSKNIFRCVDVRVCVWRWVKLLLLCECHNDTLYVHESTNATHIDS